MYTNIANMFYFYKQFTLCKTYRFINVYDNTISKIKIKKRERKKRKKERVVKYSRKNIHSSL